MFALINVTRIEHVTRYGRRVGAVDQKRRKNLVLFSFSASPHTSTPETGSQAPHLDAFDFNLAPCQIQVRQVAVGLQSFGQDLDFAALRRGRNGQRLAAPRLHGGIVHASVHSAKHLSGEIQLRNAGLVQDSHQRLAMQSRFDGMT